MSLNKLIVETLPVGQMAANCYLVSDGNETVIIDPGDDGQFIMAKIHSTPSAIVATHGHFDHLMAASELQTSYGTSFLIHEGDVFLLSRMQESAKHFLNIQADPPPHVDQSISEGDFLPLGFQVIHTPGHTPGSVTFYNPRSKIAFVGDVLFAGGAIGRTDFSYSDPAVLNRSIKKILSLAKDTLLYPGHGDPLNVGDV